MLKSLFLAQFHIFSDTTLTGEPIKMYLTFRATIETTKTCSLITCQLRTFHHSLLI